MQQTSGQTLLLLLMLLPLQPQLLLLVATVQSTVVAVQCGLALIAELRCKSTGRQKLYSSSKQPLCLLQLQQFQNTKLLLSERVLTSLLRQAVVRYV
jgi:hypothetical protein